MDTNLGDIEEIIDQAHEIIRPILAAAEAENKRLREWNALLMEAIKLNERK